MGHICFTRSQWVKGLCEIVSTKKRESPLSIYAMSYELLSAWCVRVNYVFSCEGIVWWILCEMFICIIISYYLSSHRQRDICLVPPIYDVSIVELVHEIDIPQRYDEKMWPPNSTVWYNVCRNCSMLRNYWWEHTIAMLSHNDFTKHLNTTNGIK